MAEENQTMTADSGGKSNKIVLIATVVNTLGMLAVVALSIISFQKQNSQVSVEDISTTEDSAHGAGGSHGAAPAGGHGEAAGHGGGHGDAGGHGGSAAKTGGVPADTGKIIPLEGFQINLAVAAGSQPRYLKMNMSFELEQGANEDEVKSKTPKLRDSIINILNSKKASDISSSEGRDLLKEQVRLAANGFLKETKVKNVYFSNFVISQ